MVLFLNLSLYFYLLFNVALPQAWEFSPGECSPHRHLRFCSGSAICQVCKQPTSCRAPPPAMKHSAQAGGRGSHPPLPTGPRSQLTHNARLMSKGWQPLSQEVRGTGMGAVKVMPAPSGMAATMLPCSPQLRSRCACTWAPARGRGQGWGGQAGWYLGTGEWATENPSQGGRKAAGGRTNVS